MIAFVILHHLAISYAAQGTWFYSPGDAASTSALFFSGFMAFNQSFLMGFLFLLSAYFAPASYDKKGFFEFIKERIFKLGIPLLFYVIIINPILTYVLTGKNTVVDLNYFKPFIETYDVLGFGHMWFVALLLLFDLLYALFRVCRAKVKKLMLPRAPSIVIVALLIAIANFVVRIWVPLDRIYKPINLHFPFLAQYVAMFIAGLLAYRGNWFPRVFAGAWPVSAAVLAGMIPVGLILAHNQAVYFGRFTLYSFLFNVWEQLFGISVIITLFVWFRDHLNSNNRFISELSASSYATYVFHQFALIPTTLLLTVTDLHILLKFAIMAPVALVLSFSMGWGVRKIPGFKKVFG